MTPKLQEKLISKYPKLFDQTNKQSPMRYGIGVNNGWYNLIDAQSRLIQGHVDEKVYVEKKNIFEWLKQRWNKFVWNKIIFPILNKLPYEEYQRLAPHFQFRSPIWIPSNVPIPQVEYQQIKEKFGNLRVYQSNGDDFVNGVIAMAEVMSEYICEDCGTMENVSKTKTAWIRTLCKECSVKHKNRK